MNPDIVSLDVAKALAEVWPLDTGDRRHLQWMRPLDDDGAPLDDWQLCGGRDASNNLAWGHEGIAARTIGELLTEVDRRYLDCECGVWDGVAWAWVGVRRSRRWGLNATATNQRRLADALGLALVGAIKRKEGKG